MLPLSDILSAVRQRYRLELAIFGVIFLGVIVTTALAPRVYSSTATLLFDEAPIDPVQGDSKGGGDLATMLSTQADVIGSDLVAARVVNELQLVTPDVLSQWRTETGGTGDVNLWYGERLLRALSVVPDRASRVLQVTYKSGDSEFSAVVANAFVHAYLGQKLELQTDPAKTYSRWYADRIREVRASLEAAQDKLTAFRRRTGIVDSDSTSAEDSRLSELQTAVTNAEVGSADISSRSGTAVGQSLDVQNSSVVLGLRANIAAKTAQIKQMSVELGPNHPDRMAAQAELAELQAKLQSNIAAQSRAMSIASSAAAGKEAALKGRLGQQKSRLLTLAADRAEFDVLKRDVDSARSAYDQVTQRLEVMRLSAVAPTSGVRQLDVARPSILPSEPKIMLRLLLGSILASLIAVAVAIVLEFLRPKVRSQASLEDATGVSVITTFNFDQSSASSHLLLDKRAA